MDFQEYNKIFTSDFNIDSISALQLSWTSDTRRDFFKTPRHKHGLLLLTDFSAVFTFPDGSLLRGTPGDLLLLPRGARYCVSFAVPKGLTAHPFLVNFRLLDHQYRDIEAPTDIPRLSGEDTNLLRMFQAAAQFYKSDSRVLLKAKVYELLGNVFPVTSTDACCLDYINRHYTQNLSIPNLASRCALCETSYRKRFKALTGLSPVQYINRLKIEKACQMLMGYDMHIQDICDFLNFTSLPYFYKVFKAYTGLTPSEYQEQNAPPNQLPFA